MEYLVKLIPVLLVFLGLLNTVPILVFLERKICAWIQNRDGPSRVGVLGPDSPLEILGINTGPWRILGGFMQPLADAVKLITKEVFVPAGADKVLFTLGPVMSLLPPLLAFIVIPAGPDFKIFTETGSYLVKFQVADLNIGILFILAVASLSAYGIAFGGWASNNKYALLGGVRAMAQMISYEVGMGIVILAMIMAYDTVSLRDMVYLQTGATKVITPLGEEWINAGNSPWSWGLFHQPLAFILFVICAFAENNRLPFDLPECEAELVGGFHTEYNSMGFGMYFQGEYIAMLGMGALIATFFLGGWHYPGYGFLTSFDNPWITFGAALIGHGVWAIKALLFVVFSMHVRWTLARFRWDQLMDLGWKGVIPLALANLLLTAFLYMPVETDKPAKKAVAAVPATAPVKTDVRH